MKPQSLKLKNGSVKVYRYHTVIVGAGAAGMNCAVHLYEMMTQKGVVDAQDRICVVTRGQRLGASRMSGSDKQTYYKMGTSPSTPDSAEQFAKSLTAAGCTHEDLALIEGIGSLREFYHLVQSGVPFPHDALGVFVGYKTDHDPYERATSAGPKTSKFMSECLQREFERYGVAMYDRQEVAEFLVEGEGERGMGVPVAAATILPVSSSSLEDEKQRKRNSQDRGETPLTHTGETPVPHMGKMPMPHAGKMPASRASQRIVGVAALDMSKAKPALNVFLCENLVLAAGGPGELYKTSVYPAGQVGLHGLAMKAGLAAENLTELQFGLASTKFRWNVSGTYMQVVPRIFSTAADGKSDEREFLCDFFPSMSKLATDIFLKGYQWPFDPQRIENYQSSLIDMLVFNETQQGRRVYMDFRENPRHTGNIQKFVLGELENEALDYLQKTGAMQPLPIQRLEHMNPLAIEIYREHGIDLHREPLEIAVCAQHQNGGLAVSKWWESSIPHTFVIGEMAGTHGVKRPGGSALNSGQTGGLRAATYIANVYAPSRISRRRGASPVPKTATRQVEQLLAKMDGWRRSKGLAPSAVIADVQARMTSHGAHVREIAAARAALAEAVELCRRIAQTGLRAAKPADLAKAIQAEHLALTSVALLRAIVAMLEQGAGSRGSHIVLAGDGEDGMLIHPAVTDPKSGKPLRIKPENVSLRSSILRIQYEPTREGLFDARNVPPRKAPADRKAFEPAWKDYREGRVFGE